VFWHFVSTGQVSRLDTMMVPLGCIGHFILLFACLVAAVENRSAARKWWKFAGGGAIAPRIFRPNCGLRPATLRNANVSPSDD